MAAEPRTPVSPFNPANAVTASRFLTLPPFLWAVDRGYPQWATLFHAFGAEVTVVEFLPMLLPREDEDMGRALERSFKKRGIDVLTNSTVSKVEEPARKGGALRVTNTDKDGNNARQVEAENVLIGVSRSPNTAGLELQKTGARTGQRGYVEVDDQMRTSVASVFAIGDVTGKVPLAHVASHQGLVAAGQVDLAADHRVG